MDHAALPEYFWIVVSACFFAFFFGAGLGANDVANTFGSSVAAKALTFRQATAVGTIMEFLGAVFLGQCVMETVQKGVVRVEIFEDNPEIFMIGMFCALIGSCIWEAAATYWAMPVASTHTIIGGIVGFAVVAEGQAGVCWPCIGKLIASWFSSPILSGLFSSILYCMTRKWILRHEQSLYRGYKFFKWAFFFALLVTALFISVGRSSNIGLEIGLSVIGAFLATVIFRMLFWTKVKRFCDSLGQMDTIPTELKTYNSDSPLNMFPNDLTLSDTDSVIDGRESDTSSVNDGSEPDTVNGGGGSDLHNAPGTDDEKKNSAESDGDTFDEEFYENEEAEDTKKDDRALALEDAELFAQKTERLFSLLQVLTASIDCFAHGANDLANSIAPVAGIWLVYRTGSVNAKGDVPIWQVVLGAAGMSFGLAAYGWKVMTAIGVRLAKITPSRGFAIESGAAIVVLIASRAGIPVSTTHCQVGATIGVGLTEKNKRGAVNWIVFAKLCVSWVATLLVSVALSALLFSFAVFSPSKMC